MQAVERWGTENTPEKGDNDESFEDVESFEDAFSAFTADFIEDMNTAEWPFQTEQHPVGEAPNHESPVGPMPDAAYREDNQRVECPTGNADTVATQGNVQVVAETGGEGNVPSAPKFLNAV